MLPQQIMIGRVINLCQADERIRAALQYGSFTQGEGDRWADIEFWLFVEDDALRDLDERAWVAQVAPMLVYLKNEFGSGVAIFENLVRGEFHFAPASTMAQIREWPLNEVPFDVEAMVVLDRTGELREHLQAVAQRPSQRLSVSGLQALQDRFANWFLFGLNLWQRGEWARSLDVLSHVQRHLLWMVRVVEGEALQHYLTPSKRAEADLSPSVYARYASTTSRLEAEQLQRAYLNAWEWYEELADVLVREFGTDAREQLREALRRKVVEEQ